ncbi:MAG TPA: hypothetical protein VGF41_12875 [Myxococcaceae bacterium]
MPPDIVAGFGSPLASTAIRVFARTGKPVTVFLLALISMCSVGCGLALTRDAVPCGGHETGMEIWSDSKGMTCAQARATVDQAIAIGVAHGFWDGEPKVFLSGMRLQFIGDHDLAAVGHKESLGFTVDVLFAHTAAVAYGGDQNPDYTTSYIRGQETWPSAVILAHEMTHMWQCEGFLDLGALNNDTQDHCDWAHQQAPLYADLGWSQFSSNFMDKCEKRRCSGAACSELGTSPNSSPANELPGPTAASVPGSSPSQPGRSGSRPPQSRRRSERRRDRRAARMKSRAPARRRCKSCRRAPESVP